MLHLIWVLIIGSIIGAIAGAIVGRDSKMGCWANIVAGLVGSWIGERLLGDWGWHLAGIAVFPAIIGAVILVIVVSFIFQRMR